MKITEQELKNIISESINRYFLSETRLGQEGDDGYDASANQYGQGWGPDSTLQNRQGYNADGTKGPWFSRSVAVVTCVLLQDTQSKQWYVLGSERGEGAADYQGMWNLPAGYLDYNEDTDNAAIREVWEETGIKIPKENLRKLWTSSSPYENRQNVCFVYVAFLKGDKNAYGFSKDNMEENEVGGINWISVSDIDNYRWAFGHGNIAKKIVNKFKNIIEGGHDSYDAYSYVSQAIDMLKNGGNIPQVIDLLDVALHQMK